MKTGDNQNDELEQLRNLTGFEEQDLVEAIAHPTLDQLIRVAKAIKPKVEEEYITINRENDIWATNKFYGRVELWIGEPLTDCRFGCRGFTAERPGDLLYPIYPQERLTLNSELEQTMTREFPKAKLRKILDSYTGLWSHHTDPEVYYGNLYTLKTMNADAKQKKIVRNIKLLLEERAVALESPGSRLISSHPNQDEIIYTWHQAQELRIVADVLERFFEQGYQIKVKTEEDQNRKNRGTDLFFSQGHTIVNISKEGKEYNLIKQEYKPGGRNPSLYFRFLHENRAALRKEEKVLESKLQQFLQGEINLFDCKPV